jgi:hypothetical protein
VWVTDPVTLAVQHADVLGRGEQCLEVTVTRDGQPGAGALVAVYRSGRFLYRQPADAQGRTVFRFAPGEPGEILVTATYPQSLPALGSVQVP